MITNKVLRPGRPWHRRKRLLKKIYHGGIPLNALIKQLKIPRHELESKKVKAAVKEMLDSMEVKHIGYVTVDTSLPKHEQIGLVAKVAREIAK